MLGKEPRVGHLRVFGCVGYAHLHSKTRGKLDHTSIKCRLLGYDHLSGAYRVQDLDSQRLHLARNVVFQEDQFSPDTQTVTVPPDELLVSPSVVKDKTPLVVEAPPTDDLVSSPVERRVTRHTNKLVSFEGSDDDESDDKNDPEYDEESAECSLMLTHDFCMLTLDEAMMSPEKTAWTQAIARELSSIESKDT